MKRDGTLNQFKAMKYVYGGGKKIPGRKHALWATVLGFLLHWDYFLLKKKKSHSKGFQSQVYREGMFLSLFFFIFWRNNSMMHWGTLVEDPRSPKWMCKEWVKSWVDVYCYQGHQRPHTHRRWWSLPGVRPREQQNCLLSQGFSTCGSQSLQTRC